MRTARSPLFAFAVLALFLFSGCVGKDPPATIRNFGAVPVDAPSEVGDGNFRFVIKVVSEMGNGTPIAGAPVLIYPIADPVRPPSVNFLHARNATYAARTDESGTVVAPLVGGNTYSFQATSDGYTREFRHVVKMDRHIPEPYHLVLFRANKTIEMSGTLPATPAYGKVPGLYVRGGLLAVKATTWLREVDFHPSEDPKLNREYVSRLQRVQATVSWENKPEAYGDLGIRVAFDRPFVWENDVAVEQPGAVSETMTLLEDALEYPTTHPKGVLRAGPMTRMPVVAPAGLSYKVTIEAEFSTDPYSGFASPYCRPFNYCITEPE